MSTNTKNVIEDQQIPFNTIIIPDGFNVRVEDSEVAELAKNIAEHGLMNPLVVEYRPNGDGKTHPFLVSGFRRALALKKLRWGDKGVRVSVKSFEKTLDAYFFNIDENLHREDVHPLDLGARLNALAEGSYAVRDGETPEPVDKKVLQKKWDFQKSHVNNLMRLSKKLAPEIQAFWRKHWTPGKKENCFSLTQALAWCGISLDKKEGESAEDYQRRLWDAQVKAFEKWREGVRQASGGGRGEGEEGAGGRGKKDNKTRPASEIRGKVEELHAEVEKLRAAEGDEANEKAKNQIAWTRYVAEQKKIALEWALGEREVLSSARRPG